MEVDIKILKSQDLAELNQLLTVFDVVFEYEPYTRPSERHLRYLMNNTRFHAFVATLNDRVIAGLTAYSLDQYHSIKPVLYVQDLAVLNKYQRKGIGRKLIEYTNTYCINNGFQEMFIQAEKIDDYAVEFYRSTRPTEELQVVHFSYAVKANL